MRFSERWLREWVDPPVSSQELVARLTLAGVEVDAVEPVAEPLPDVVVGRILEVQPHPAAERLRVCRVDAGTDRPLTVVCGAPNTRVGLFAPVALPGARLPRGLQVQVRDVRGVRSEGVLCSGQDLGLEDHSEGLLELLHGEPGASLAAVLELDDLSIDVDLTPNRADCLSVAGLAREVAAIHGCVAAGPDIQDVRPAIADHFPVEVLSAADCPRYLGRVLRGIDDTAESPLWMRERLRRSGVRSLGPVVDVTNYVMLELGQPMHAFDLRRLAGHIEVRRAASQEALTALDGQRIVLREDTLVIADRQGAQAIAGIMGGQATAVSMTTRDLFLESAFFHPLAIAGRARAYGLATESSRRFERGVDPELARRAMERATGLLLEIAGGRAGPIVEVTSGDHLPSRPVISLRRARVARLLGVQMPAEEVRDILNRLGMDLTEAAWGWEVRAPSFRFDIANEADLIEELARIRGYDRIPTAIPSVRLQMSRRPEAGVTRERVQSLMADRGYHEAITYSFISAELQESIDPERAPLALSNPLASDMAVMRTSLWPGLLAAALYNVRRQQPRVRLFETGVIFLPQAGGRIAEHERAAAVAVGPVLPEQWGAESRTADFFDLKGDVEAVLTLSGCRGGVRFTPEHHPALHRGQSARIWCRDTPIGWLGVLHPRLTRRLELPTAPCLFELDLAPLAAGCLPHVEELSKFPGIRRDVAVVVEKTVTAEQLCRCVADAAGEVLRQLTVFDLYEGPEIDANRKSVALGLTLQHLSRTLTDQEVDAIIECVIKKLREEVGAKLRGGAWR